MRYYTSSVIALTSCLARLALAQSSGSFNLLTFNVAGLPDWLSDNGVPGDKATNAGTIGSLFAETGYDIIHIQEDFAYNDEIYSKDNHPYRTVTSGNVLAGSGLNTLSNFQWTGLDRVTWQFCWVNEADCLTPKGFTFMRINVGGAEIDLYNAHADAGDDWGDKLARSLGVDQLLAYINSNSAGRAVIIAGDLNDRWYTSDLSINKYVSAGFSDVWATIVKGGVYPTPGSAANYCSNPAPNTDCEVVDKILFRSGDSVKLNANSFSYKSDVFKQPDGNIVSDHNPVLAEFSWSV
ncbi:unnamed protein product [Clonostachys byssicola]|uniref:Inositol polyphosphate-related phosphatase domain-containing protein n=1 Tax=Clonostachys byssicola TaxID=160290 RepID=A0A9N9Y7Q8_9HYPO|nr:unnamed protein product [Clonostachys byssicola]